MHATEVAFIVPTSCQYRPVTAQIMLDGVVHEGSEPQLRDTLAYTDLDEPTSGHVYSTNFTWNYVPDFILRVIFDKEGEPLIMEAKFTVGYLNQDHLAVCYASAGKEIPFAGRAQLAELINSPQSDEADPGEVDTLVPAVAPLELLAQYLEHTGHSDLMWVTLYGVPDDL